MIATKKRRGRPPKFVHHPDDNREIFGLSAQPKRKGGKVVGYRYYATFSDPREWFGHDLHEALQRFKNWDARQKVDCVSVEVNVKDHHPDLVEPVQVRDILDKRDFHRYDIPRPTLMRMIGDILRTTEPAELAEETGIRELAWLWKARPAETIKLDDLGAPYFQEKNGEISTKEYNNSKVWWDEFCKITGASTVDDLDRATFLKYRKQVIADQKRKKLANSYTRSRFGKIKSIINYALDESPLEISDQDRATLVNRSVLKMPPKPKPKPIKLSPEELTAILKVADDWETALILTALNAAYQNVDCRRLRWSMIDWDEATIRFDRQKSEELADEELPRLTVLWDRTIRALRKLGRNGDHVFAIEGRAPHIDTIYGHFLSCCDKSGVAAKREKAGKKSLSFHHLRKSAISAASNDPKVPDRHVDLLAGHSAGIKEHYVVPENVILAARAVEAYYFPKKSRSRKK